MAKKKDDVAPEWPYMIAADGIEGKPLKISISPNKEEAEALAQRLGVNKLVGCEAVMTLERSPGDMIVHVTGEVKAKVEQNCVVSLAPVESDIHEQFEAWYADPEQAISLAKAKHDKAVEKGHREIPIMDERDDPEPMIDGQIDAGELTTQYLSLAINPYPHAEGAEYDGPKENELTDEASKTRKNPFAALKDWKGKHKE